MSIFPLNEKFVPIENNIAIKDWMKARNLMARNVKENDAKWDWWTRGEPCMSHWPLAPSGHWRMLSAVWLNLRENTWPASYCGGWHLGRWEQLLIVTVQQSANSNNALGTGPEGKS